MTAEPKKKNDGFVLLLVAAEKERKMKEG